MAAVLCCCSLICLILGLCRRRQNVRLESRVLLSVTWMSCTRETRQRVSDDRHVCAHRLLAAVLHAVSLTNGGRAQIRVARSQRRQLIG